MPRPNLAKHLGEILDGLPDAVVVTDDCGTIVWVNSQVENLFGYKPDELVGETASYLTTYASTITTGYVIGGTLAVSDAVKAAMEAIYMAL